jgi:peptide/nickel transport system permease protein
LQLVTASLLLTVVVGISLGMLSALKRYSVLDHLLTTAAFGSMSIPEFFLALCGIYLFSLQLNLLPSSGVGDVSGDWSLGSYLKHLAMPATILALRPTAILMRYARSSFLEVMRQDYMTVASAKGLGRGAVVLRHGLKNALIPLITVIGLQLPLLVSGAFIIETIFAWPGMGTLLFNAIFQRDYPVIMGVTLVVGIAIVFCNLAADIAYSYADPRIKYE